MPVLRELYDSLVEPRALAPDEVPFAEFLREQGALSLEPPQAAGGMAVEPVRWALERRAGLYELAGDGEGGAWRYLFEPGQSPCLSCLLRWWLERFHPPEWWQRMQDWPDFRLSWPAVRLVPEAPVLPGWLHYRNGTRRYRGRVFAHPQCGCLQQSRWPRHWGSWTHPITGPLTQVVQRQRGGLWRVSLHLHEALSSGAHPLRRRARRAAVAEACERWAALQPCADLRIQVRRLGRKARRGCWSGLVYLGEVPGPHGQQLSHGLACGSSLGRALRAGFWELIERDALRRWWNAWKAGRPVPEMLRHGKSLWSLPGRVGRVFLAFVGRDGAGAWGSAAGPRAVQRARREARHNYQVQRRKPPDLPGQCLTFGDHAAWAWHQPLPRWQELVALPVAPLPTEASDWKSEARALPVYYYRLACPWAERLGWTVVKVLSPHLRGLGLGGQPPFHPFS